MRSQETLKIVSEFRTGVHHHFRKIFRESAVFFCGSVATSGAAYFFKIYLARTIGAEGLGVYALGMTIVGFAGVLGALGLPQAASRFVAVYRATGDVLKLAGFLSFSLILLTVTNLLIGALVFSTRGWIAARLYHEPALAHLMLSFVLIMLVGSITTFLGQCLAGYKDVAKRTIIFNFVGTPVTMILTVAFIARGAGLRGYLIAQLVGAFLVLVLLARAVWKLTPNRRLLFATTPSADRAVASFSLTLFGNQVLEFMTSQADRILLGIYLSARELGVYSIAMALVAFVPIVLQSINQIFAPTIAELHAKQQKDLLLHLYQLLTKWIVVLTFPLALVIIVFAEQVMKIFGSDFGLGWPVLAIAAFGQIVNCGVGSVGQLLTMCGQQQRLIRAQLIIIVVTIVLDLCLIPKLGLTGAAVTVAIADVLLNLFMLRDVINILSLYPSWKSYLRLIYPITATVLCLGILRIELGTQLNFMHLVGIVAVAYIAFGIVFVFTGIEEYELLVVTNGWSERNESYILRRAALAQDAKSIS